MVIVVLALVGIVALAGVPCVATYNDVMRLVEWRRQLPTVAEMLGWIEA